ncbi:MAG: PD-(D/E)XK nuclease family protein [Leptolyngbyaceae cyanobacterium SL_7_1]|nr:PD-(D/E)XK nuclease family protein [Leptolyngbyaceae cyanobacterium SL_7_1]
MRISQGQLNLLETCPRKFQHIYLDQFVSPIAPEQFERMTWGSRFHLLMQQRELGLPIDRVAEDNELQQRLQTFLQSQPQLFHPTSPQQRSSEHLETLEFQGVLLTVVYDLLILENQRAEILDWKTHPRPLDRQRLLQDWQTRLYLFVLAESTHYLPEQISITYWFVQGTDSTATPQSRRFDYTPAWHQQTRRDLTERLHHWQTWLQNYQQGEELPQVAIETGRCDNCQFAVRCQRLSACDASEAVFDLEAIPEVVL